MKKTLFILCLCLTLSLCAACATQNAMLPLPEDTQAAQQNAQQSAPAPEGTMPPYTCSITFETVDEEVKADDGTVILHIGGNFPIVEISNNEKAAELIYNEINDDVKDFTEEVGEVTQAAKADYAERGVDFMPYGLDLHYNTERADQYCISFSIDEYAFTGGAHPNPVLKGVTFDTATGKELDFEDIVTDEKEAEDFVAASIKAYLDANKDTFILFEDYADHIGEILEEAEWYFTPTDFVIICNENIVGPHAMGIIEIPIAYSDFLQLKSDYTVAK